MLTSAFGYAPQQIMQKNHSFVGADALRLTLLGEVLLRKTSSFINHFAKQGASNNLIMLDQGPNFPNREIIEALRLMNSLGELYS